MEWMLADILWRNNENGLESPPSPELQEAIETLDQLEELAEKL